MVARQGSTAGRDLRRVGPRCERDRGVTSIVVDREEGADGLDKIGKAVLLARKFHGFQLEWDASIEGVGKGVSAELAAALSSLA